MEGGVYLLAVFRGIRGHIKTLGLHQRIKKLNATTNSTISAMLYRTVDAVASFIFYS